jgi:D-glycero-D-manno-heptose 1,7-bisphosphate phosphatase
LGKQSFEVPLQGSPKKLQFLRLEDLTEQLQFGKRLRAVLFDRDGTLVVDVPYNADPDRVTPVDGAKACLDRLRAAGLRLGVVTNQSGVGRRMMTYEQMLAVNRRVDELLGPFDGWFVCPHAPEDDCECRKPKPKLLLDAAKAFAVEPYACIFLGDKDDDAGAADKASMPLLRVGHGRTLAQACAEILQLVRSEV